MHIGRWIASKILPDKLEHALFEKLPDEAQEWLSLFLIIKAAGTKYKGPGAEWLKATDVLLELAKKDAAEITPNWDADDKAIAYIDEKLDGLRKELTA